MSKIFTKSKRLLITITLVIIGGLVTAVLQNRVIAVEARLHPIIFVAPCELEFGMSFPQEKRDAEFTVVVKHTYEHEVEYKIIQERKPLPEEYVGDGEDPDMPGFYRNLCPYLTKTSEEDEGDTHDQATLNPINNEDLVDYWLVEFAVPTIKGYVDQGFVGTPVDAPGEFGCDIKVDIIQ